MKLEKLFTDQIDEIGDQHLSSSRVTPMRPDAFDLSNSEKILLIEEKCEKYFTFWVWILLTTALVVHQQGSLKCL